MTPAPHPALGSWTARIPDCPAHGRMNPDPSGAQQWVCHGFDGEGCDHVVKWADVEWHPLGTIAALHLGEAEP